VLRPDLNIELSYRFIRHMVWVAVRWYRPDKSLSHDDIAAQYLHILLDGISMPEAYIVDAVRTPVGKRGGQVNVTIIERL
jgi:hypothetical protein